MFTVSPYLCKEIFKHNIYIPYHIGIYLVRVFPYIFLVTACDLLPDVANGEVEF